MEASKQTLPGNVQSMIIPAVEAVQNEARAGTRAGEHRRLLHELEDFLRRYTASGYRAGIAAILAAAFPGVTVAPARERTCECDSCTEEECDGHCESCDEYWDCAQHGCGRDPYSCCGYCPTCESHHGEDDSSVVRVPCRRNGEHVFCTDCEHECDG